MIPPMSCCRRECLMTDFRVALPVNALLSLSAHRQRSLQIPLPRAYAAPFAVLMASGLVVYLYPASLATSFIRMCADVFESRKPYRVLCVVSSVITCGKLRARTSRLLAFEDTCRVKGQLLPRPSFSRASRPGSGRQTGVAILAPRRSRVYLVQAAWCGSRIQGRLALL